MSQSVSYIRYVASPLSKAVNAENVKSDLKQITETQASRISQLEQLLMNLGVNTADENVNVNQGFPQQQPLFWLNNNGLNNFPDSDERNLQAMRPSPEPERSFSFDVVNTQPWSASHDSGGSPNPVNGMHAQENKKICSSLSSPHRLRQIPLTRPTCQISVGPATRGRVIWRWTLFLLLEVGRKGVGIS